MFEIIAQDRNLIPYHKELNAITGGLIESIVFVQLLYWHEKNGGEFYKFKEPCNHEFYKAGDSWVEELGISADVFDRVIKKLKEKGFLEIKHTMDRRTFYVLNIDEIEKALKGIYENRENGFTKTEKVDLLKPKLSVFENRNSRYSIKVNSETTTEITQKEKEKIQKENPQIQKNQTELLDKKTLSEKYPDLNLEAFEMWCEYKGKRYTKQGKVIALNKLVKFSHEIQKDMVERSIMNNWQGLFEPKEYQNKVPTNQTPTSQEKPKQTLTSCYAGGTNYNDFWDQVIKGA